MNKTIRIHYLIIKKGENSYLGICKELGFIDEGNTFEAVHNRLIEGSKLLIKVALQNKNFSPALNVKPPFKYLALYYIIPLVVALASLFRFFKGEVHHNSLVLNGEVLS